MNALIFWMVLSTSGPVSFQSVPAACDFLNTSIECEMGGFKADGNHAWDCKVPKIFKVTAQQTINTDVAIYGGMISGNMGEPASTASFKEVKCRWLETEKKTEIIGQHWEANP